MADHSTSSQRSTRVFVPSLAIALLLHGSACAPPELEEELGEAALPNTASGVFHGVDLVHARTLKDGVTPIRGRGVVLGVYEPCLPWPHGDFNDASGLSRVVPWSLANPEWYCSSPETNRGHVTHVSGTMIGNASGGETKSLGMAPEARLFAGAYAGALPLAEWRSALVANGVAALNQSLGDRGDCSGSYTTTAQVLDETTLATGTLVVNSAGNEGGPNKYCSLGWSTMTNQAIAKNVLAVGALVTTDYSTYWQSFGVDWYAACATDPSACVAGPDYALWPSSSRGPTADGRIKPDLVAQSTHCSTWAVQDRAADNCGSQSPAPYGWDNGTSMAAPVVTGIAGLVHQVYVDRLSVRPTPSMMRAILVQTAKDRGLVGPDYWYGHGSIDANAAVGLVEANAANGNTRLASVVLTAGQVVQYQFFVDTRPTPAYAPNDSAPLVITAAWDDPAGTGAGRDLLNDVDIVLVDPSGAEHYPYSTPYQNSCRAGACDAALRMQPAVRDRPNRTDNLEQIVFALPASSHGVYTLRVKAPAAFGAGTTQSVSLAANHDVFLPAPSATWQLCGVAFCGVGGGCCTLESLGSQVACNTARTYCWFQRTFSPTDALGINVIGGSEAGLYVVEEFDTLAPSGVSLPDSSSLYYLWQQPQPSGQEIKQGTAGRTYSLSTSGTYRFSGRVRNRVSAYVIGTQSTPPLLELRIQ